MLRVLHVLEAVRGGTSRHLVDLIRNAQDVEHEVAAPPAGMQAASSGATYDRSALDAFLDAGAEVHEVPMLRNPARVANVSAVLSLRRLVHRTKPDVIHGHSSVGGAIARLVAWRSPVVCVYTPNGVATGRSALAVERILGRRTDRLVAVSGSEGRRVAELSVVPPERICVIPNGIDVVAGERPGPVPDIRNQFGLDQGTQLVGTVARLVAQKAPDDFVRGCAAVAHHQPQTHFVLIGRGPLQHVVDRLVSQLGLTDRFHQFESLPNADAVLNQLDVFVLLSRFEGGPYTPLEAMRAGTPVVLSDVVGNRDVVVSGESGFLTPFGDSKAVANAVVPLLKDRQLRDDIAKAGFERLESSFDVREMGKRTAELYRELVADDRRRTRKLPHPNSGSSSKSPDSSAAQ